jgi:YVTN family beta-propeller protein
MKLFLRGSAIAAFTFVLALTYTESAFAAGADDLAVDIAFYNARVDGVSANLAGQSFRAIYAQTSPRDLVTATDVVYAIPHDAHAPLYNATQAAGKIVLIDRGFYEYDLQATNAAAAGAVGIILVNNIGDPAVPSMQQTTQNTGVPDVMISQNDGDIIKAAANFSAADGTAGTATQVIISPDIQADRILKLDAANGNLLWYTLLGNDGSLAVDPGDLGIYTARGGHNYGNDGFIYKLDSVGNLAWNSTISLNSYCDFFYVTNVAVDAFSSDPGVVWSENGCFGALAKTDRATGAQQWSLLTWDIGRPSIDPTNGQIYTISNAGNQYVAMTIYSVTADGTLLYGSSCEGFTDLNPADGQLYRGGGNPGCGTTLSQLSTSSLGTANWSMDLSPYIASFDSLAVQPWLGGYVYVASVQSSKIVVVDPVTQSVVTTFNTAYAPKFIAVDPDGGNVYVADDTHPTVIAYGPTGALLWINPNLGGTVTNLATARGLVGAPSTPTATAATTAATAVTDTSATLNGTVNPNGSSTTVYFQYGTTTSYGSQTANQVFTGSSAQGVTASLSGLTPSTTYHYRIIAINAGGTIAGNDISFTTASPTPTPTPTPTATPTPAPTLTPCPAPTVRISSSRNQLPKGVAAIIDITQKGGCSPVTVYYTVKTRAVNGVDYTLTDQFGQDATAGQSTGPLTLTCLYTSRSKMLPVNIVLQKNKAYYLGNTKVTVNLLP